jgi:glutamate--cysteine ligase
LKTITLPLLNTLEQNRQTHLLAGGLKGLEKESLRIATPSGQIAQTPHPLELGSALTHPHITTDYSEALLEFITPPYQNIEQTLEFMRHIHGYVYESLTDEMLLTASMPCGINGDESIPIARYGQSNIGQMKHIYRQGLWHRYGRTMQAIAGIHFNYSVPEALWDFLYQQQANGQDKSDFIARGYFNLIRNFQHQGWLVLYLFGASPAICKNFFKSRPYLMTEFDEFDEYTLYHPYATSLRMSDIGYKSKNQADLAINYNSLNCYVDSLTAAINTPYPAYEAIGVKVNGEYKQLNAHILQIENEYYSTIRPKQIAHSGEKPTLALKRRGVRYIEIRSLDLDVFKPLGIDATTGRFLEAFLLTCLMQESPEWSLEQQKINNYNQLQVAHQGRDPELKLQYNGEKISLQTWAEAILNAMQPVCAWLDQHTGDTAYQDSLQHQFKLVNNPDLTPSAQVLKGMRDNQQPYACFALAMSEQHRQTFLQSSLNDDIRQQFTAFAKTSLAQQTDIEAADILSFDDFLTQYFKQH